MRYNTTLQSGQVEIQCHRGVLSAQCGAMEKWLKETDANGVLNIAELIPTCALASFVELMYKGECDDLSLEAGLALIQVFKRLEMKLLTQESLLSWIWEHFDQNAIELLHLYTSLLNLTSTPDGELMKHVEHALGHKILDLFGTNEWKMLAYEDFDVGLFVDSNRRCPCSFGHAMDGASI